MALNNERRKAMDNDRTTTCPCGNELVVELRPDGGINGPGYEVCGIECDQCGRTSTGGNFRTGIVNGWITAAAAAQSQAEYERQCWEADNNEWYGRGNW